MTSASAIVATVCGVDVAAHRAVVLIALHEARDRAHAELHEIAVALAHDRRARARIEELVRTDERALSCRRHERIRARADRLDEATHGLMKTAASARASSAS